MKQSSQKEVTETQNTDQRPRVSPPPIRPPQVTGLNFGSQSLAFYFAGFDGEVPEREELDAQLSLSSNLLKKHSERSLRLGGDQGSQLNGSANQRSQDSQGSNSFQITPDFNTPSEKGEAKSEERASQNSDQKSDEKLEKNFDAILGETFLKNQKSEPARTCYQGPQVDPEGAPPVKQDSQGTGERSLDKSEPQSEKSGKFGEDSEEILQNLASASRRSRNRKIRKQKNLFQPAVHLIASWLRGLPQPPRPRDTSEFHIELVVTIIRRKLSLKSMPPTEISFEAQLERHFIEKRIRSLKRTEENNKFLFKHTLKLMKGDFRRQSSTKASSLAERNQEFFNFYFCEEGREETMHELFSPKFNLRNNSLPISTLREIFSFSKFARDFLHYLVEPSLEDCIFATSYDKSIEKKLIKIFKKWENVSLKNPKSFKPEMLSYFRKSSQCKLPWTTEEVQIAIRSLLSILE